MKLQKKKKFDGVPIVASLGIFRFWARNQEKHYENFK